MEISDVVTIRHNGFNQNGKDGEVVRVIYPYLHLKVEDGYILIRDACVVKKKKSLRVMYDEYLKKIKEEEIVFLQKW